MNTESDRNGSASADHSLEDKYMAVMKELQFGECHLLRRSKSLYSQICPKHNLCIKTTSVKRIISHSKVNSSVLCVYYFCSLTLKPIFTSCETFLCLVSVNILMRPKYHRSVLSQ